MSVTRQRILSHPVVFKGAHRSTYRRQHNSLNCIYSLSRISVERMKGRQQKLMAHDVFMCLEGNSRESLRKEMMDSSSAQQGFDILQGIQETVSRLMDRWTGITRQTHLLLPHPDCLASTP
ncbi:hypothetical protein CHARACLAT_022839, partial [Characodon lateralis]|nr:hypothetical protein [Characodon lateralis]